MKKDTKLRIKVNSQALVQMASLVSNSIILSTNVYLLGSSFKKQIKDRKTEAVTNKLQLSAEVASAVSGLAKVVVSTLDNYEKG